MTRAVAPWVLPLLLAMLAAAGPGLAAEASRHWLVAVSDVAVSEESCMPHQAVFTVRLSKRVYKLPPQVVTVEYATGDGTAVAGVDYTPTSGTLTFTPPDHVLTVSVAITDALVPGPDKTFTLNLSNPAGAVLSRPIGTATLHAPTVAKCRSCSLSCDDGDACTADFCDSTAGCRHPNASATATPYCQLAGVNGTPDPNFDACNASGQWIDSDGDGFSDAAEAQGYLDLNGNGFYDGPGVDLELPGADPHKPDVYVHYDWMDYGRLEYPCTADADCPQHGSSPLGTATCTGPAIPGSLASCEQACETDADCQDLGEAHASDRCAGSVCQHTHDPEALAPGALDAVATSFEAHGIALHIERGRALPHSHVVSFRLLTAQDPSQEMNDGCEGGSVTSGSAGIGEYAESFYDLKARYLDHAERPAYHYILFGHYSGCDTPDHCALDAHPGACPLNPQGCGSARIGQSGSSEINGNDFIVSLGSVVNDNEAFLTTPAPGGAPASRFIIGGTWMHELGHNLGLRHGGGVSSTPDPASCQPPDCEDECTAPPEPNFKPNYLSVMNYRYQFAGIQSAFAPGASVPVDTRLDYSAQALPTVPVSDGLVAVLDEADLDETPAFGLTSGNADLFTYTSGGCLGHSAWPTHGPVDWDGSGVAGDNPAAFADLNPQANPDLGCHSPVERHRGHVDWGPAPGQSAFRYAFQCTQYLIDPSGDLPAAPTTGRRRPRQPPVASELTATDAREARVLYPTTVVRIAIQAGCSAATTPPAPGPPDSIIVALFGGSFAVADVEASSLRLEGVSPVSVVATDVDGDGEADLLMTFGGAQSLMHRAAGAVRLSGWLKSSQAFVGEAEIAAISSATVAPVFR